MLFILCVVVILVYCSKIVPRPMPEAAANVQPQVPPVPVSGGVVEMVSASDIDDEPIATGTEDPDFTVTTPTRRVVRSENASTTDTMYVGRSASITALVGEINRTSACKTDGCKGELKCTKVLLQGRGGTINCNVLQVYWL